MSPRLLLQEHHTVSQSSLPRSHGDVRAGPRPPATSTGQDQSSDPSSAQISVLDFPHHLISLKASVEEVTMIQERLMGHSRGYGGGRS